MSRESSKKVNETFHQNTKKRIGISLVSPCGHGLYLTLLLVLHGSSGDAWFSLVAEILALL
jgi:poly(3-hydroxybutyrate) depolymerase